MSEKEKRIVSKLKTSLPHMTGEMRSYIMGYLEGAIESKKSADAKSKEKPGD